MAEKQGGLTAIEQRNIAKAKLIYDLIDVSSFTIARSTRQIDPG